MDIISNIFSKIKNKSPFVFIEKLEIYTDISLEKKELIRSISFNKGVNIVWAENSPLRKNDKIDIIGHSVGKTTLCRFIRHILGEENFSNTESSNLIAKRFPNGWIAGQIEVNAKKFAVLRPLGKNLSSRVGENMTIDELIENSNKNIAQYSKTKDSYTSSLGLEEDYKIENPRTGETANWSQVLSWCTRDQEARYRNLHTWREVESESGTSAFNSKKAGPLFLIRKLLALFSEEELIEENNLAKCTRSIKDLEEEIKQLKIEPTRKLSILKRDIQNLINDCGLNVQIPTDYSFLKDEYVLLNCEESIEEMISEGGVIYNLIKEKEKTLYDEIGEIQVLHSEKNKNFISLSSQLEKLQTDYSIHNSLVESGNSEYEAFLNSYKDEKDEICNLLVIKKKDCPLVKERYEKIQTEGVKSTNEEIARRKKDYQQEVVKIQTEITETKSAIETIQYELNAYINSITTKKSDLNDLSKLEKSLKNKIEFARDLIKAIENPDEFYQDLTTANKCLETLISNKNSSETALNNLVKKHASNNKLLTNIYSACIKKVLKNSSCKGQTFFSARNLEFRIERGKGLISGQAVMVLTVLLADISSMIYSLENPESKHPLFIIHDSPKEADLADDIYLSFIEFMIELSEMSELQPFQYIITTTSPPPKSVIEEKPVLLKLKLSNNDLLLKKNIFDDESPVESNQPELNL